MVQGFLHTKDYMTFLVRSASGEILGTAASASHIDKALPGDSVEWNSTTLMCTLIQRTKHYPIVGILELASKTKYGMTSRGSPMYLFTPCRKEYPMMVVGCSERDVSCHRIAVVDFDVWTSTGLPRGVLRRILGVCGDPSVERMALRLTYNPFGSLSLKNIPDIGEATWLDRPETPETTFNIDPEGCRDIDDVISIRGVEDTVEVWITIADVSEVVTPSSVLDEHAARQGLTCYENGNAVQPMLPHAYSEGYCSLVAGQWRPGVSLVLVLREGRVVGRHWLLTKVRNSVTYTYENFLDKAPTWCQNPLIDLAYEHFGMATRDPHKLVEAAMLSYNLEAAKILRAAKQGVLRKHEAPDLDQLAKYTALGGDTLAVLAQRAAQYCAADDAVPIHYGLSAQIYCHASSPIRRYADLLNQRVLKAVLSCKQPYVVPDCMWLNRRQRDMKQYERDLFFLEQVTVGAKGSIEALVLEFSVHSVGKILMKKYKLWVAVWKRVITWKTSSELPFAVGPGVAITLSYFANPGVRFWKDRIVFRYMGIA
jgi:exoribonuclease R